ncbi:Similar to spopla: Speckle-type POZ protein-like A (Danio rerio) [Cotesia congregata]|uniref:Similar to spopla: Speckle-type POZ protein-like A (Danio rerio) n=1 Tax=Cotesia congregata TaxID=51543 RepID=A0A8J2MX57_COTCN|nr:Similar to spopla: Speckle-type POZ protein-like A (Danio rerio) [Cotesia congregata]
MEDGYTFIKKNTLVYEWEIDQASSRIVYRENQPLTTLKSSTFSTQAEIAHKLGLKLYFNSDKYKRNDFLELFISNLGNNCVKVDFSIGILNSQRKRCLVQDLALTLIAGSTRGFYEGFRKQLLLANKSLLMPNDLLTICAEVTIKEETKIPVGKLLISPKSHLSTDFRVLYNSRECSDVTIVIGDEKIKAHRLMLKTRSPVLAAMFTHELDEKKSNQVFITDITADTFQKLLEFIYTDEVSDLNAIAEDLLEAADKYQILSLKEMCEVSLCKSLEPENAIRRMDLADRHNAPYLLEYVTKCIIADPGKIIETEDFGKFEKFNPHLGLKLFKRLAVANIDNKGVIKYSTT